MTFGLTDSGFVAKRLLDIVAELEAAYRTAFGQGIKTTPDTTFGKLIGIHADREAKLWELAESVYLSQYPNSATGLSLARIGELTDVTPNPATRSIAVISLSGTAGTLVPRGTIVAVQGLGAQFRLTANAVLNGDSFAIQSITRSSGIASVGATGHGLSGEMYVFITGADQTEYNGLKSISVTGANTFTYPVSGTPVTPATGAIQGDPTTSAPVESAQLGAISAIAGTLIDIVNPLVGWDRAENAMDASLGRYAETDSAFRARRLLTLKGLGAARQESILGALLSVSEVTGVVVFVNDTDSIQGNRPAHSIECLVVGGDDQDILDMIWNKKAAGIQAYGTVSGNVVDSQGASHVCAFSRADEVNIYLELDLTVDANFPSNGISQVITTVLAYGASLDVGQDVIITPSLVAGLSSVIGILGITVRIGTSASPTTGTNIIVNETQIAIFDSGRIEVNIL